MMPKNRHIHKFVGCTVRIPLHELKSLPTEIQEKICEIYAMEYDSDSTNAGLIDSIREIIL